jgi:membrane-associated protein
MEIILNIIHIVLHLDQYLGGWAQQMGPLFYVVLFLIIFAETGLVLTPFLPGDSLLFAVGAVCALSDSQIDVTYMGFILFVAALLGDNVNYQIGKRLGPKVFSKESSRLLNKNHLIKTQNFYETHGGKTLILARFMPIVRTFAPFVAGIGQMKFFNFISYSLVGAAAWISSFLFMGFYFGNRPEIKSNFHYVILAVIIISLLPLLISWLRTTSVFKPKLQK